MSLGQLLPASQFPRVSALWASRKHQRWRFRRTRQAARGTRGILRTLSIRSSSRSLDDAAAQQQQRVPWRPPLLYMGEVLAAFMPRGTAVPRRRRGGPPRRACLFPFRNKCAVGRIESGLHSGADCSWGGSPVDDEVRLEQASGSTRRSETLLGIVGLPDWCTALHPGAVGGHEKRRCELGEGIDGRPDDRLERRTLR